ncbi:AMP-binding protein [Clostridium akagii]|uniref:AMP-binding protein n=1 Tax=Clostridium akagii TaxID=91623 RepID=UPI00047CEC45|nr:AMP-binding protein [Clostridium akagii]
MNDKDVLLKIFNYEKINPHKIALVDEFLQLTYQELVEAIEEVSKIIREQNLRGKIVALQIPRSIYFPILVFALTKENITFIPQDIAQPIARLEEMVQLAGAQVVISLEEGKYMFDEVNPASKSSSDAWSIYFTSGSTGTPKAVEISEQNVENTVIWQKEEYELTDQDKAAAFTPYSFAVSYMDLFSVICAGGTLYILSEFLRHDLAALEEYLNKHKITFMNATTMIGDIIIRSMDIPSLRLLTLAGQRFPDIDLSHLSFKVINVYGNTECGAASICKINSKTQKVTIGKPVKNTKALILGNNLQVLPEGEIGELFIYGVQVSREYFMNSKATKEAFININYLGKNLRGYRTGDFARVLPDGNIEYLGRRDRQYKINGVRIDLSEIERAFYKLVPTTKQLHVVVYNEQLYCWFANDKKLEEENLLQGIADLLPSIMIPSRIKQVNELPVNGNSKIDEKKLFKALEEENESNREVKVPSAINSASIQYLKKAWSEILNIDLKHINVNSDFKKLGATSLQIMELGIKLLQDLGKKLNFVDLHYHTKLYDMVGFIDRNDNFQPIYTFVKRTPQMENIPALFVIHSGNTGSDVYKPLFNNIKNSRFPIYVIEPHNLLTPEDRIEGIENIADYYIKLIENFMPEIDMSRFNLMGWSYGGVIANEICHQLESNTRKKKVDKLTLLDSPFYLEQSDLDRVRGREANGYYRKYFEETHIFEGMDEKNITTEHLIENNHQVFLDIFNYKVNKTYTPTTYIRSMIEEKPLSDEKIHSVFDNVVIKDVYAGHDYLFVDDDARQFIQKELDLVPME